MNLDTKSIYIQEYDQEVQLYCTECGARYELTLDDLREVSRFGKVYCPECEDREPVNNVRELHILWLN